MTVILGVSTWSCLCLVGVLFGFCCFLWTFGSVDCIGRKKLLRCFQCGHCGFRLECVFGIESWHLEMEIDYGGVLRRSIGHHCWKCWMDTWCLYLALRMKHESILLCQFPEFQVLDRRARSERGRRFSAAEQVAISLGTF